jgi:hypothetical protein
MNADVGWDKRIAIDVQHQVRAALVNHGTSSMSKIMLAPKEK